MTETSSREVASGRSLASGWCVSSKCIRRKCLVSPKSNPFASIRLGMESECR